LNDNFFHLGGGDSTKAILLSSELEEIFGKEIAVVDLFEYVTIKSFLDFMDKPSDEEYSEDQVRSLRESSRKNRLIQRNRRLN